MGIEHKVFKRKNGYICRVKFDTAGVPKFTNYLNYETGCWEQEIVSTSYFPTKELAEAFMRLRLISEGRWGEIQTIAHMVRMHKVKPADHWLKHCPTFDQAYKEINSILGQRDD